jgi:hypothetical protein
MNADRDDPESQRTPDGANPVASALRALASCVEFLLSGGRRDLRRERQKLNEAQRLITDIESRPEFRAEFRPEFRAESRTEVPHGPAAGTGDPAAGGPRTDGGSEAA